MNPSILLQRPITPQHYKETIVRFCAAIVTIENLTAASYTRKVHIKGTAIPVPSACGKRMTIALTAI